jgi:hypothetical protein
LHDALDSHELLTGKLINAKTLDYLNEHTNFSIVHFIEAGVLLGLGVLVGLPLIWMLHRGQQYEYQRSKNQLLIQLFSVLVFFVRLFFCAYGVMFSENGGSSSMSLMTASLL